MSKGRVTDLEERVRSRRAHVGHVVRLDILSMTASPPRSWEGRVRTPDHHQQLQSTPTVGDDQTADLAPQNQQEACYFVLWNHRR